MNDRRGRGARASRARSEKSSANPVLIPATPSRPPDFGNDASHGTSVRHADDPTLARLGTFSDGVFAFAMTLLILAIRIPHPTDADAVQGLLAMLTQQWRSYLGVLLSFMLVGINWANHRVMLATFARATHTLIWLNLLYLLVGSPRKRTMTLRSKCSQTSDAAGSASGVH